MRFFIDEDIINENVLKSYVLSIKDFSHNDLMYEYLQQHKNLYPDHDYSEESIKRYYDYLMPFSNMDLITMAVEEKFYVFNDEEEHPKNKEFIENIINN